jgi:aminoglycoside phosphotransferase (APT) family kinase protein
MEVADRPVPNDELGPLLARGRDAAVFALGADRVARRTPERRDHAEEAAVMEHVRAAGYPVPRVWRIAPGEMVLERVEGPTMLEDLGRRPWRVDRHARTLAGLHRRLHAIDAPAGLRPHPVDGHSVLHLDLHPGNVILAPAGPVVIDWTNAHRGDGAADIADTWITMALFEDDPGAPTSRTARWATAIVACAEPAVRRRLVDRFLDAAGRDDARRALHAAGERRRADPNVRPSEAAAIDALVAREARSR